MPLPDKGIEIGQPAPYWELKGPEGQLIKSTEFSGRSLLLFFFRGTWCPSCRDQMQKISVMWERIKSLAPAIGIAGENQPSINRFLTRHPLPFPLISDPTRQVIEAHNVYQKWGLYGFNIAHPSTLVIDREGLVRYCYVGSRPFDRPDLEEVLLELKGLFSLEPKSFTPARSATE
jgi:peroxiredoxin Q/BCP